MSEPSADSLQRMAPIAKVQCQLVSVLTHSGRSSPWSIVSASLAGASRRLVIGLCGCWWNGTWWFESEEVRFVTPMFVHQLTDSGCPRRSVIDKASRADSLRRCQTHQSRDTSFPARRDLERDFVAGLVGVDFFFGLVACGVTFSVGLEGFDDGRVFLFVGLALEVCFASLA